MPLSAVRLVPTGLLSSWSQPFCCPCHRITQIALSNAEKQRLDSEVCLLHKRLEEEEQEKLELEDQMRRQLEDAGDAGAEETVAAYEAKYNRLKTRYRVSKH
jgi:hypothetical protein